MPTLTFIAQIAELKAENEKLTKALEFYANPENRSACLINQYEFTEKYFKKEYIVDVCETKYLKDNGAIASQALNIRFE